VTKRLKRPEVTANSKIIRVKEMPSAGSYILNVVFSLVPKTGIIVSDYTDIAA